MFDVVTRQFHTKGFNPIEAFNSLPTPPEVLGWRNLGGDWLRVGKMRNVSNPLAYVRWDVRGSPAILDNTPDIPDEDAQSPRFVFEADVAPDWQYRINYILSVDDELRPATPKPVAYPPPGDRDAALQAYVNAAKNHKDYRGKWGDGKRSWASTTSARSPFNGVQAKTRRTKVTTQELWWWLDDDLTDPFQEDLGVPFPLSKGLVPLNLDVSESRPVQ